MTVLLFGLAAAGLAALVKVLPWPAAWLPKKPLACAACMAGHASWVVLLFAWATHLWVWPGLAAAILLWLGMTGVAVFVLAQTGLFTAFHFEGT